MSAASDEHSTYTEMIVRSTPSPARRADSTLPPIARTWRPQLVRPEEPHDDNDERSVSMSGALLASLPTLLVYVLLGKYFIGGLMSGSVKG